MVTALKRARAGKRQKAGRMAALSRNPRLMMIDVRNWSLILRAMVHGR